VEYEHTGINYNLLVKLFEGMDTVLKGKDGSRRKRELDICDSVDSVIVAGHHVTSSDERLESLVTVLTPRVNKLVCFIGGFRSHNQVHNINV